MSDDQLPIEGQVKNPLNQQLDESGLNQVPESDLLSGDDILEADSVSVLEPKKTLDLLEQVDKEPDDIFGAIDSLKVEEKKTSPSQSVADAQAAANPVPTASKLNFVIKLLLGIFLLGILFLGVVLAYPYIKNKFFGEAGGSDAPEIEIEAGDVFYNFPEEGDEIDYLEYEEEVVDEDTVDEELVVNEDVEEALTDDLMVEDQLPLSDVLNENNSDEDLNTENEEGEEDQVDLNKDTDNDGLTDEEEKKLGTHPMKADTDNDGLSDRDEVMIHKTDPLNPDTDGDGLSDYDEIMIYKTNPLNPDTDGDGYTDGVEVSGGYNPNGPGKLEN